MLMVIPEFNIAFSKAKAINKLLSANGTRDDHFVSLDEIIEAVKKESNFSDITVFTIPFSTLDVESDLKESSATSCGAMLSTTTRSNHVTQADEKVAHLVINSDYSADMQRFSVVHELGHLITNIPNFTYEEIDDDQFTLSAHIHPDITFIPEEDCKDNKYLIAEQVANIFALLVLIPQDLKIRDLKNNGIEKLTEKYGVTEDAIFSRMLLSSVTIPEVCSLDDTGAN